jgi:SAM-dependent methyltransferase
MNSKAYWDSAHRLRPPTSQSWFQPNPAVSLSLIRRVTTSQATILDAGGGASTLVDGLLLAGYQKVTVLDLSPAALQQARERLGPEATAVRWIEADLRTAELPAASFDLWHDRAVFHFLTAAEDRAAYLQQARRAVRPGGFVLMATFADDGPSRCSGLDVVRYSAAALHAALGGDFQLLRSQRERHRTPDGVEQAFVYCLCRYEPPVHEQYR